MPGNSFGHAPRIATAGESHSPANVAILDGVPSGIPLIDEIFTVGGAGFRIRCEERYRKLRAAGHTVIVVSHEPRTVASCYDRAILIDGGRVLMDDRPDRVADTYVSLLQSEQVRTATGGPEPTVRAVE